MPFIFCMYFLKKNTYKDLRAFFIYTLILFISVLAVITFRYFLKSYSPYLIFYRFFIVGEFSLVTLFFSYTVINKQAKKVIQFLLIPFFLYSIYDFISTYNQKFTYYPLVLECLLFPLIIIFFFYEKMKYSTKFPIYLSPSFWIAVGFLIFSSGNFFLFLFSKLLLQNEQNKDLYNHIYGFFTVLKNIFLCTAVVIAKNSRIEDDEPNINIDLELETFTSLTTNTNLETTK